MLHDAPSVHALRLADADQLTMFQGSRLASLLAAHTLVTRLDVGAAPIDSKPMRFMFEAGNNFGRSKSVEYGAGSSAEYVEPLVACLAAMRSLQALCLWAVDPSPQLCDVLARLPVLDSLQLDRMRLSAEQAAALAPHLARLTQLARLRISGAPCALERSRQYPPLVPQLSVMCQLRDLTLDFAFQPTEEQLEACVGGMANLTSIQVSGRVFTESGQYGRHILLEHLSALPQLARLVLMCDMDMDTHMVVACARQLPGLHSLRELRIDYFQMSQKGVAALSSALASMPQLSALTFGRSGGVWNQPSGPADTKIDQAPLSEKLTSLKSLSLTSVALLVGMRASFAQQLRSLTSLTALELDGWLQPIFSHFAFRHQLGMPLQLDEPGEADVQPNAADGAEMVASIGHAAASLPALGRASFSHNAFTDAELGALVCALVNTPALTQLRLAGYVCCKLTAWTH